MVSADRYAQISRPISRYMYNDMIIVFVRTLCGSLISIQVDRQETILDMKRILYRNRQGSIHSIQLKYKGRELEDEKTVADYKIENGVTIDRITHLRELIYEPVGEDE